MVGDSAFSGLRLLSKRKTHKCFQSYETEKIWHNLFTRNTCYQNSEWCVDEGMGWSYIFWHLQYSKTGVHTGNNSTRKYCASCLISHCHSMQGAVEEGHGFSHLGIIILDTWPSHKVMAVLSSDIWWKFTFETRHKRFSQYTTYAS